MEWETLLNDARFAEPKAGAEDGRSAYQRDFDRIVFSSAFRRLQDKTQVHPLANTDYVRRRLTHSLEVSSIGRSLGSLTGTRLLKTSATLVKTHPALIADIGNIVSAACLAHDIGNPPFGHSGEKAIAQWFSENNERPLFSSLSKQQKNDLGRFEGNAQGFRILTRLQNWKDDGGMRLTFATLGTFSKYPCASDAASDPRYIGTKKFGYFEHDAAAFTAVAEGVGLTKRHDRSWSRHPLVFLVEAADDICYRIIDLEDGYKLGRIPFALAEELLLAVLAGDSGSHAKIGEEGDRISYLRARAIGRLIGAVHTVFSDHQIQILAGTFDTALLEKTTAWPAIQTLDAEVFARVFEWDRTIKVELAGINILHGLLDDFADAVENPKKFKNKKLLKLLPGYTDAEEPYLKMLRVTDYISGMTDRFALDTYRSLRGIALQ